MPVAIALVPAVLFATSCLEKKSAGPGDSGEHSHGKLAISQSARSPSPVPAAGRSGEVLFMYAPFSSRWKHQPLVPHRLDFFNQGFGFRSRSPGKRPAKVAFVPLGFGC